METTTTAANSRGIDQFFSQGLLSDGYRHTVQFFQASNRIVVIRYCADQVVDRVEAVHAPAAFTALRSMYAGCDQWRHWSA